MNGKSKKTISLILALAMSVSLLTVCAFADEDPTGFGINDMSYEMAVVAIPIMNEVFDACNVLAGAVETWTDLDGSLYSGLTYGDGSRGCQKYDLYIPKGLDKSEAQGVLLFIHGGTWTMGDRESMAWAAARYAKLGYIAATMDYDLASQGNDDVAKATGSKSNADIFDMLDDVTDCVAAIKAKTVELGYSVDGLALSGTSAGSHITALWAYARASESAIPVKMLFNITTPVGFHKGTFNNYNDAEVAQYASIVAGEILTEKDLASPDAGTKALLNAISPVSQVTWGSVPTLLGFADKDTTIGTNQYNTIKPVLDYYGVPNDVVWWHGCDHTLIGDPGAISEWDSKVALWLDEYVKGAGLPFGDVTPGMWFYDGVKTAYEKGYMQGVTPECFAPNEKLTRAQMITVLYRMAGSPDVTGMKAPFKDVSKDAYYYKALLWGYNKGIVKGFSETKFAPNSNTTRAQFAAMLYRYAGSPKTSGSLSAFSDSGAMADCYTEAMLWTTSKGIIQGFGDGSIRPNALVTRAQTAVMISRYSK